MEYQSLSEVLYCLNKKAQKGYCDGDGTVAGQSYMCDEPDGPEEHTDTHEAFVFFRPIEEEEEVCPCREVVEFIDKMEGCTDNLSSYMHKFCPECGEPLK